MIEEQQIPLAHKVRFVSPFTGWFSIAAGTLVLAGWIFDIPALRSTFPGTIAMKANTAAVLVCCGTALLLLTRERRTTMEEFIGRSLTGIAFTGGLATFIEYAFHLNLGIDEFLFHDAHALSYPGRMAPAAAVSSVLVSAGLFLINVETKKGIRPSQWIGIVANLIPGLTLVGYVYNLNTLYQTGPIVSMALLTAVSFAFLGVGIIAARPGRGLMATILSPHLGSVFIRRIVPIAFLVTVPLGFLRIEGQAAQLYGPELGLNLLALSLVVGFLLLSIWSADFLNKLDVQRADVQGRLRESEERFRSLVENMNDVFYVSNPKGKLLYASPNLYTLTGYRPAELLGQSYLRFVYEHDRRRVVEFYRLQFESGAVDALVEFRVQRKDSEPSWVELATRFVRDSSGAVTECRTIARDITERKRGEDAVRNSAARFRSLIEYSQDVVAIIDEQGTILFESPSVTRVLGYGPVELVGRTLGDYLHPDDRETFAASLAELAASPRKTIWVMVRVLSKDGMWRTIEGTGKNLLDEPAIHGIVLNWRDVTERWNIEEALRANEEKLRNIIENSTNLFYSHTVDNVLRFVSPQTRTFLDCEPEEALVNWTAFATDNPVNLLGLESTIRAVRTGKRQPPYQLELRGKRGRTIWVEVNEAPVVVDGSTVSVVGSLTDITERKKSEEARKQGEAWLNAVFDASRDGIIVEHDTTIVYANKAFATMLGYTVDELIGQKESTVLAPDEVERILEFGQRRLRGEQTPSDYELKGRKRDGTLIDLEVSVSVASISDKTYLVVVVRDISERKLLEAQLRQTAKLESIGTLAGGIAHDFNNILGIIMAYGSRLERATLNPKEIPETTATILRAAERGAALVRQILTFARKGEAVANAVQANYIIKELASMLHQTFPKTMELKVNLDRNLPIISIDASQLNQAVMNLCVNARDAILESNQAGRMAGTIVVKTSFIEGSALKARFPSAEANGYILISVADNGIGMDEKTTQRMFEPFFTTKGVGKGSGLGLSVVYGVVKGNNGFIDVRSTRGVGTEFLLYFPVPEDGQLLAGPEQRERAEPRGGAEVILVVEDEEALCTLMKDILEDKGYNVITADNGDEAVKVFENHKDAIHLVLSDLGLPKRSGIDAVRDMRRKRPGFKCIIASGYMDPIQKSEALKSGVNAFIQKPYDPADVVRKVREVLDGN